MNTSVLAPRGFAYLQGIYLPSWAIEVEQTAYNTADTINVLSPLAEATQDWGKVSQDAPGPIPFRVRVGAATDPAGYNGSSFNELIYGFLDEIDSNYDDDTIEFRGRGILALLADTRTTQIAHMNVNIGAAVSQIVKNVGLNPVLTAQTNVKVGQLLNDDHVATARNIRVLEFIQLLVNGIGWNVRCQGQNVIIGPPPAMSAVPVITKTHGAGGDLSLKITHSALHAHDIKVKVISYMPKSKAKIASGSTPDTTDLLTGQGIGAPATMSPASSTARAPVGRQSGFATGNFTYSQPQEYIFHIPGLTQKECDAKAAAIQAELSRHEFIMDMEFAPSSVAELRTLVQNSPEFLINLRGCSQASHNQLYHPRHITWTMSQDEGIRIKVTAVNHDVPQDTGGE